MGLMPRGRTAAAGSLPEAAPAVVTAAIDRLLAWAVSCSRDPAAAAPWALAGLGLAGACQCCAVVGRARGGGEPAAAVDGTDDEKGCPNFQLAQEIPIDWAGDGDSPQTDRRGAIRGRLDHMAVDSSRQLLYLACLGADCVAVVDCFAGVVVQNISEGLRRPQVRGPLGPVCCPAAYASTAPIGVPSTQGVLLSPATGRLYVANAVGGVVNVFDCRPAGQGRRLGFIDFEDEADNLRCAERRQ